MQSESGESSQLRLDLDRLPITGWYPGHMLKAGRQIKERLSLVDLVVELLDARIPLVSRNPAFDKLFADKLRCLVFTKADLADEDVSESWRQWHGRQGREVFFVDSLTGRGLPDLLANWKRLVVEHGSTASRRRQVARVMIAGIPNIGKSTLVNRLSATKRAQVGPRPGVTRHQQWIPLGPEVELLDTPGVLWPKIETKRMELKLALCGTIKDELIGEELLVEFLLEAAGPGPNCLDLSPYGLSSAVDSVEEFLDLIGRQRGFLKPGGRVDIRKSAIAVLKDFRDGRLGRLSFDPPPAKTEPFAGKDRKCIVAPPLRRRIP